MPPKNELARAIRALRSDMGLSQQQFSDRLGVTLRTIAHYENDRPPTDLRVLNKLYSLAIQQTHIGVADVFAKYIGQGGGDIVRQNTVYAWSEAWVAYNQLHHGETVDFDAVLQRIMHFCQKANPEIDYFVKELYSRPPDEAADWLESLVKGKANSDKLP